MNAGERLARFRGQEGHRDRRQPRHRSCGVPGAGATGRRRRFHLSRPGRRSRGDGGANSLAGRRALALKADLADAVAVGALSTALPPISERLDVLVPAAGAVGTWRETAELAVADWDRYLAVDLSGAFYAIRAALPHLRKAGGGAIVAISSIAAQMCQARNVQGAAAKAGVEAMVRVVAREEGRRGIRANAVAVGLTDTEMGRAAFAEWGPETTERIIRGIPLRRIGTPEEVARVVCFLAGPDGAYITGKVLQVDGGQIIAA